MQADSFSAGRRMLLAGFGGLLLLMLVGAVDSLITLRQVDAGEQQVREAYLTRDQALEQIRAGIFQSAIILRDFLLAADDQAAREQADNWDQIHTTTEAALARATRIIDEAEKPAFAELQDRMTDYWMLRENVLRGGRGQPNPYSSGELVRRRKAALTLIDRIDRINQQELAAADATLDRTFSRLRLRSLIILGVSLTLGVVLAYYTIRRTLHLEKELQRRYEEGERARLDLKSLSARLVSAQEEERRTISRELHDEVGQSLSALLMEAGNAASRVPPESMELRRHFESIRRLAEASVQVIRNMTLLLRPSMLDDFGLLPALEWQAREVSKRTGMRIEVEAEENTGDLPDDHKTCIYRVVQEALHNCARHAQAGHVRVEVRQEPSKIVLSVADDGRGFDPRRTRGLGLVGMEERVNHLGGSFRVDSRPKQGTTVEVELPLAS